MILKEEIQKIATQKQLATSVIEKDYVLSWVLAGIHHHNTTKDSWIFKGGTCLKKCYFETYRFSEDLDFTYRGKTHEPDEAFYKNVFIEISQWIFDNSGIELPEQGIEFEVFKNKRDSISVQGKLPYRGPVRPSANIKNLARLKIDLTLDEPLVLEPSMRKIEYFYSDATENKMQILCYSYEEIFAEKLRALVQRLRPRDLYDVVHLFRRKNSHQNPSSLKHTLQKKCAHRSVAFPTTEYIENHNNRKLLESEWSIQLRHQLPTLPPCELFLAELPKILDWISNNSVKEKIVAYAKEEY